MNSSCEETYKIGIIGIAGKMGRFLADYMINLGHRVSGYDVKNHNYAKKSQTELARSSDILLVSVPIGSVEEVIRSVGPYVSEGSLFTDVTSIKYKPVKAMLESSSEAVEVIGTHPMFAPRIRSIQGQKVILTPARGDYWLPRWRQIFEKKSVEVTETTPENHDKIMHVVQRLTHARNIVYAIALKELLEQLGLDIKTTMECASPIYRIEQGMTGRILGQNPDLYASIQIDSPLPLEALYESTGKLLKIVKEKDSEAFVGEFTKSRELFGDDLIKELTEETDFLVEKMSNRRYVK